MSIIELKNISKIYKEGIAGDRVKALDGLDLKIEKGEIFGFLGPNGSGKSTAIKILLNLIFPSQGSATIMSKEVKDPAVRKHVGFLPENPYFYDHLTATELLRFGGQSSGLDTAHIREKTEYLLDKVGLTSSAKRQLRTYSKGMVQRVGLALALIHDPEVVILDEPMSGLDPIGRKMVGNMILELKQQGKTVFFSSHILNDIEQLCDRVGIIVSSRLRNVDRVDSLLSKDKTLEDVFLDEVAKAEGEDKI